MIGSIKGEIILKKDKWILVEAAGVGYRVNVPPDTLLRAKIGDTNAFFFIHTHVREDALDLYGFSDVSELEFFEMLIGVSGIGPRGALAILGITSIETLRKAISTGDISYLTKISGIGKKTAEKIVIELRDKLADQMKGEKESGSLQGELDALEALKSLGYSQSEAREALKKIDASLNTNAKIKEALKMLAR
jgi:holliday junction DNA helicase RuvA